MTPSEVSLLAAKTEIPTPDSAAPPVSTPAFFQSFASTPFNDLFNSAIQTLKSEPEAKLDQLDPFGEANSTNVVEEPLAVASAPLSEPLVDLDAPLIPEAATDVVEGTASVDLLAKKPTVSMVAATVADDLIVKPDLLDELDAQDDFDAWGEDEEGESDSLGATETGPGEALEISATAISDVHVEASAEPIVASYNEADAATTNAVVAAIEIDSTIETVSVGADQIAETGAGLGKVETEKIISDIIESRKDSEVGLEAAAAADGDDDWGDDAWGEDFEDDDAAVDGAADAAAVAVKMRSAEKTVDEMLDDDLDFDLDDVNLDNVDTTDLNLSDDLLSD